MSAIDLRDDAAVARRVVEPVLAALFRDGEIAGYELRHVEGEGPQHQRRPATFVSGLVVRRGEAPRSEERPGHWCTVRSTADDDVHEAWLGGDDLVDADDVAHRLAEQLEDWVCETAWGWGEQRRAAGFVVPD